MQPHYTAMTSYQLDYSIRSREPRFTRLAEALAASHSCLDSQAKFNLFCRNAISLWSEHVNEKFALVQFQHYLAKAATSSPSSIPTSWGGVYILRHEHPEVEKFLVVKGGCYLAFEKHERKEEELLVKEGAGLLLYRKAGSAGVRVLPLCPDTSCAFLPGEEHCVVGCQELLILEKSKDYKGMDKDLVFIFTPEG